MTRHNFELEIACYGLVVLTLVSGGHLSKMSQCTIGTLHYWARNGIEGTLVSRFVAIDPKEIIRPLGSGLGTHTFGSASTRPASKRLSQVVRFMIGQVRTHSYPTIQPPASPSCVQTVSDTLVFWRAHMQITFSVNRLTIPLSKLGVVSIERSEERPGNLTCKGTIVPNHSE